MVALTELVRQLRMYVQWEALFSLAQSSDTLSWWRALLGSKLKSTKKRNSKLPSRLMMARVKVRTITKMITSVNRSFAFFWLF